MYTDLIKVIRKIANALWLRIALERVLSIGFYAVIFIGVVIILFKAGLLILSVWDYLVILLIGLVVGLVVGISRRPSLYQTAMFLDDALFLKNRLATSLECLTHKEPNAMEMLLLNEVADIQPNIKSRIAYNKFNVNYIFRFSLATLGVLVLWLVPITISPAQESFNKILNEQSLALVNTSESIKENDNLDSVSKSLANQMELIAQAIKQNTLIPQEILKQIEGLKSAAEKEIAKIDRGEKLLNQISLMFSDNAAASGETLSTPEEISRFIRDIEERIRKGQVNVDIISQLKKAIKESLADMPENESLKEALNALENPDLSTASFSEPMQEFFRELAQKNRYVIESIQARLKIVEREIKEGAEVYKPLIAIDTESTEPVSFSIAGNQEYQIPRHQAGTQPEPLWTPSVITDTPRERIELIEEVIKARASALQSPIWSSQYDEVIREYFK